MVARRVANPALPMLATVNPRKRGRKMATKRRKTAKRAKPRKRSNPTNPANPVHKRRHATKRKSTRRVHARKRGNPVNPVHRRRRHAHRRSNPLRGAGTEILNFTVAGISLGLAQPFLTRFAGGLLPFGQYNAPILSAGTGWILSKAFEMFSFTRRFAHPTLIFGFATAAMQVLQPIVRNAIGVGGAGNPTMSAPMGWNRRPMRGIGVVTGIPPGIAPLPPVVPGNKGMQGIGVRPGVYGR